MPLQKRRHSNSRTRKRRTHYKLTLPSLSMCPRCSEPRLSYHVCPKCGYYGTGTKSRQVIDVTKKEKQVASEES
jgi:large subunit ribosomal protein L32